MAEIGDSINCPHIFDDGVQCEQLAEVTDVTVLEACGASEDVGHLTPTRQLVEHISTRCSNGHIFSMMPGAVILDIEDVEECVKGPNMIDYLNQLAGRTQ